VQRLAGSAHDRQGNPAASFVKAGHRRTGIDLAVERPERGNAGAGRRIEGLEQARGQALARPRAVPAGRRPQALGDPPRLALGGIGNLECRRADLLRLKGQGGLKDQG
jgi:hypothetical protein